MDEKKISKAAVKLGEGIGKSKIWKDFRKARESFKNDQEVQELLHALREKEKIQSEKLEHGVPIEVEEKHEIKEIEEKLSGNAIFLEFVACENRYLALMGNIDRAIKEGADTAEKGPKEEGDTGDDAD